jgi:adenylate cyclase class 2
MTDIEVLPPFDPSESDKNLEIEVKFYMTAAELAAMPATLDKIGATLTSARIYERNMRYENTSYSLTAARKVIRLRQDSRVRLTYKEPSPTALSGVSARTELEVTVSDFETMDAILGKLGYFPAWEYEKYRTTYTWRGAEIVLDELPYGYFIEIEGGAAQIEAAIQALGLNKQPRIKASYSDLFFQLKTLLSLKFIHLTFDNFKNVTLPDKPGDWLMGTSG